MTRADAEACKARMEERWPGSEYELRESEPTLLNTTGGWYVRLVRRAGSGAPTGAEPMPLPAGRSR